MPGEHLLVELERFCTRLGLERAGRAARVGKFTILHRYSSVEESQKKYGYQVWTWSGLRSLGPAARKLRAHFLVLEGAEQAAGATQSRHFVLERSHLEWLLRKLRRGKAKLPRSLQINTNRVGTASGPWRAQFITAREVESETALRAWLRDLAKDKYRPPPYRRLPG